MESKTPALSQTIMNEAVLPNDTNVIGTLFGGRLLQWMDICAAMAAGKHSRSNVVTASVDNVSFQNPIRLGDVVHINAKITRSFNTSMEVHLEVWAENIPKGNKYKSNEAFYTFVSIDENCNPIKAPELVPETDDEKKLFESALRRRELRMILAGRMKPEEAAELKALFE